MTLVYLFFFTDEIKNIKPKEELEEEKHNKMVVDSESPNEEGESENGKNIINWDVMTTTFTIFN